MQASTYTLPDTVAKFRRATSSSVLSVRLSYRPSARIEQVALHWKYFWWNFIFEYFSKYVYKIQVLLKSEKVKW